MWPFSRIARGTHAALSKYLSPEGISLLENGSAKQLSTDLRPARICFILLQVRDNDLSQASTHLARAIDTLNEHGGLVTDMMGSCVLAMFGHPATADAGEGQVQRDNAASRLAADLGEGIRLICGDVDGLVGTIGSQRRLHYGCLMPQFDACLSALFAVEFGKIGRVTGAVAAI